MDYLSWPLEKKIGQLFVVGYDGDSVGPEVRTLIEKGQLGGLIASNLRNGLEKIERIRDTNLELQALAAEKIGVPLLLAVDEEGGVVKRLREGFTPSVGNGALGYCDDVELTRRTATVIAKEARAVGFNVTFSPVTDVNENPSFIGVRSFGSDPALVARHGKAYLQGLNEGGMIGCLKHFPGHGKTPGDSHVAYPEIDMSEKQLEQEDLVPFARLASRAPMMMSAHVSYPQIDSSCATLSQKILEGIAREKIGFKGVMITDSLGMKGVNKEGDDFLETVCKAINAGNDMLLISGKVPCQREEESHSSVILRVRDHIVAAVRNGAIAESRINASLERIMELKAKYQLARPPLSSHELIRSVLHLKVAREGAQRAIEVKKGAFPKELEDKIVQIFAHKLLQEPLETAGYGSIGKEVSFFYFDKLGEEEQNKALATVSKVANQFFFFSYNAMRFPEQLELLKRLPEGVPLAFVAARDPYELEDSYVIGRAGYAAATRSPTAIALEALFRQRCPEWGSHQAGSSGSLPVEADYLG